MGTLVARASHPFASALHSPLAGTVVAIESREAAVEGGRNVCIVIAGDGSGRIDERIRPPGDPASLSPEQLIQRLRDAGIAGLGGAGFPTATKLDSARTRGAQTLVLNGAECEPWICCDDALMRSAADDVVVGALLLQRAAGAGRCVIAIEDDKPEAIAAVTGAIERQRDAAQRDDEVTLAVVPAVYPQGAERQLITAVDRDRSALGQPARRCRRDLPERRDRRGRRALGCARGAPPLSRRDSHGQRRRATLQRPGADRHPTVRAHRGGRRLSRHAVAPDRRRQHDGSRIAVGRGRPDQGDELRARRDAGRHRFTTRRRRIAVHPLRRLRRRVPRRTAAAATAPGGARRCSRQPCGNSACATASIAVSATTSAQARFRSPIVFVTRGAA